MSVPKKRTSYQKKKMRYFRWVKTMVKWTNKFYFQKKKVK